MLFCFLFQCLLETPPVQTPWRRPSPRPPSPPSTRTTTRTLCPPRTRPPRTTTRAPRATRATTTRAATATTTTLRSAPRRQAPSPAGGGAAPLFLCSRGIRGNARLGQQRATGTLRLGWQVREIKRARKTTRRETIECSRQRRLTLPAKKPLTCLSLSSLSLSSLSFLLPIPNQNRRRQRGARE